MKIFLRTFTKVRIPDGYGFTYHEWDTVIPAVLAQVAGTDRFNAVFDDDGTLPEDSHRSILIEGMTVGMLAVLCDRNFIRARD